MWTPCDSISRGFSPTAEVELCLRAVHIYLQHQIIFNLSLHKYFLLFFFCINRNIFFVISKKKKIVLDLKTISAEVLYLPPFRSAANPNMIYRKSLLAKGIVATEIMNYLKVTFNLLPKKQASIAQGCWGNRKAALDQFTAEKTC